VMSSSPTSSSAEQQVSTSVVTGTVFSLSIL